MSGANISMLMDFYELTMANGYLENGAGDDIVYFDMFFRRVPDGGGFALFAGLEQFIEYIENLRFLPEDIDYLRGKKLFSEKFLDYLMSFRFTCDIWSVAEGTPIFPGEPLVTVRGTAIQAQLIETMLLLCLNHQSLIATKTSRIVRAAQGRAVMEFGSRRAQGADGAVYGARAAYIAGAAGTACTMAEQKFGVKAMGTMAHSWVMLFESELEAFRAYARVYPDSCTFLVDTYSTLKSGVPNAITVFGELRAQGYSNFAIRIDSGDIAYLSKHARRMLDSAGFADCKIVASNSLDEYIIRDLIAQGAPIDSFGVGERLITGSSEPVFGGVYKLAAVERKGKTIPKIKLSDNVSKITNPSHKALWRLYDNETGKAFADIITLAEEVVEAGKPYELFDPDYPFKRKTVSNFTPRRLQKLIFKNGECVYNRPQPSEIRAYCEAELNRIWDEVKRFENPHKYIVDLSQKLWDIKQELLFQGNRNMDSMSD